MMVYRFIECLYGWFNFLERVWDTAAESRGQSSKHQRHGDHAFIFSRDIDTAYTVYHSLRSLLLLLLRHCLLEPPYDPTCLHPLVLPTFNSCFTRSKKSCNPCVASACLFVCLCVCLFVSSFAIWVVVFPPFFTLPQGNRARLLFPRTIHCP